jgi:hypothetical protein
MSRYSACGVWHCTFFGKSWESPVIRDAYLGALFPVLSRIWHRYLIDYDFLIRRTDLPSNCIFASML